MKILYVVEVKDSEGTFQPYFGLNTMNEIVGWMKRYIRPEMLLKTSEWRIVKYGPLFPEEEMKRPLIH